MDAGGRPMRPRVKSPTEIPTEARQANRQRVLRQTLLLMLGLTILGAAGLTALGLLHHAMRPPSADDTARLMCTSYTTQNYDPLIARVDGNTADANNRLTPFNASAKSALKKILTSADLHYGKVKSCSYKEQVETINPSSDQRSYFVIIQRASQPIASTLVVYLVKGTDGGWYIARKSDFGMPQTGA